MSVVEIPVMIYVMIYVAFLALIAIGSFIKTRKFGRPAGIGFLIKGFLITTVVGFGLFVVLMIAPYFFFVSR